MAIDIQYPYVDHKGRTRHDLVKVQSNCGRYLRFKNQNALYEEIICKIEQSNDIIEADKINDLETDS